MTVSPVIQGRFLAAGPRLPGTAAGRAVQRRANGGAEQVPPGLLRMSGGGRPLPDGVRQKMESFFKADFSDVRVHVGAEAPAIGALAFTMGSSLYFAPGQYNPDTLHGQQLLGHELTHVVQQRQGRVRNPFGSGIAVVQEPALELEADRLGQAVAMHRMPAPAQPTPVAQAKAVGQAFGAMAAQPPVARGAASPLNRAAQLAQCRSLFRRVIDLATKGPGGRPQPATPQSSAPPMRNSASRAMQPKIVVGEKLYSSVAEFGGKMDDYAEFDSFIDMLNDDEYYYAYDSLKKLKDDLEAGRITNNVILINHGSRQATRLPLGVYSGMGGGKTYSISKSKLHDYPKSPLDVVSELHDVLERIIGQRHRGGMGPNITKMMIESKQTHETNPYQSMVANFQTNGTYLNMTTNNIARCHKLADSSIFAIVLNAAYRAASNPLTIKQKQSVHILADALGGDGTGLIQYIEAIAKCLKDGDENQARQLVNMSTAEYSFTDNNLRFGYSDVNTVILYGFDPNEDSFGGTITPKSKAIKEGVEALANSGVIDVDVATSTTGRVNAKGSTNKLSSSFSNMA